MVKELLRKSRKTEGLIGIHVRYSVSFRIGILGCVWTLNIYILIWFPETGSESIK